MICKMVCGKNLEKRLNEFSWNEGRRCLYERVYEECMLKISKYSNMNVNKSTMNAELTEIKLCLTPVVVKLIL